MVSIRWLGHRRRVLLKTDNQLALVDLRRAVAERLGVQAVLGSPLAYEQQSYSSIENAARQLE
eukprot:8270871-Alexandrium_andersonii.AAC.1